MITNYYYLTIPVFFILIYILLAYLKKNHLEKRQNKNKIKARVVKYKMVTKETSRNHYNSGLSIFVEIIDNQDKFTKPLNYSFFILSRPFKINQEIDVFWYASDLYYWNSYENGLFKYVK